MTAEVPTTKACLACRSPVFDDERFCEACGASVSTASPSAVGPRPATAGGPDPRAETDLGVIGAITDRGRARPRNEDAFAVACVGDRSVVAVCDGVASTANPDQASTVAAAATLRVLEPVLRLEQWPEPAALGDLLTEAFEEAQRAVAAVPDTEPGGFDLSPSTTLVVSLAAPGRAMVANIGDSRAYWLGNSATADRQLTVDDSLAEEQIAQGMPPEAAYAAPEAHTITRWLGADAESVRPTLTSFEVREEGFVVVCSDGLWNYFDRPDQVGDLVRSLPGASPMVIARRLVDTALAAGGHDNVTVVVVPVSPEAPDESIRP